MLPVQPDLRARVLQRVRLGIKSGVRVGAGVFSEGVEFFIIGEQTSNPTINKRHLPFCSVTHCSGWLNKQLCEIEFDEQRAFWLNALDNDGSKMDLAWYHAVLKPKYVIALGSVAKEALIKHSVPIAFAFPHPQYWKRFKHKHPYPFITTLKDLS